MFLTHGGARGAVLLRALCRATPPHSARNCTGTQELVRRCARGTYPINYGGRLATDEGCEERHVADRSQPIVECSEPLAPAFRAVQTLIADISIGMA